MTRIKKCNESSISPIKQNAGLIVINILFVYQKELKEKTFPLQT